MNICWSGVAALLIDAGATARDIRPVLDGLTDLPVTVVPTHLHFDHTNGLANFDHIALVDLPETRALVHDGKATLRRLQYMGPLKSPVPVFRVAEWIRPDGTIDLGGRVVRLLWTPGHTPNSVTIHDPAARRLFTGDLIYTTSLYAFMVDSSLSTYAATFDRLLSTVPAGTRVYGAHCCRNDAPAAAPWLTMTDVADARDAVRAIMAGKAKGQGTILRRFPVNDRMTLLTLYPYGNR